MDSATRQYSIPVCKADEASIMNRNGTNKPKNVTSIVPKKRQDLMKWIGWGYNDTNISISSTGDLRMTSDRYSFKQSAVSEEVREYFIKLLNIDLYNVQFDDKNSVPPHQSKKSVIQNEFLEEIKNLDFSYSLDEEDRLFRSHGHTATDYELLREGNIERIVDIIVWPTCHDDVVKIVNLANLHNVVIIPFGGGTNVTRALECNPAEKRMIVSLDTSQMNRVLWVDKANMQVCCEAGIVGQDLNRVLLEEGLTMGHEPDSYEFSTLGGWVATRASGMKKNKYGNIEDLLVHVRFVTHCGVLEKRNRASRISCGPDMNHVVLGSEGTLGVITEVIFKVQPIPEMQTFSSYVFPTFQHGIEFMREVALERCQPASLRLMDNTQYKGGIMLKEPVEGYLATLIENIKVLYVTKYKGMDMDTIAITIAMFEGSATEVKQQEQKISSIAAKHGGFCAGEKNGRNGYTLTFVVGYIRDLLTKQNIYAESMETSVTWDRVATLIRNVKHVISKEMKARGIKYFLASSRVTQVYDEGACVYFYFAFNGTGISNVINVLEETEIAARDEMVASGGSISHHHGVGKLKQKWFTEQVSQVGVDMYKSIKRNIDPNNVFAVGNLCSWESF